MFFRIIFLVFIGYILYSLIKLVLFIKDSSSSRGADRNKQKEEQNRFSKRNNKIIELDKDQYKVE
jgi:hypothetical protein